MLTLENLTIKRGSLTVADELNLALERGKVYTILGPNGAGKSSLMKAVFGEIATEKGHIAYNGEKLNRAHLQHWHKRIGYMPQDTAVEASLTTLEVVLLGRIDALNMHIGDDMLAEAANMLAQLGIAHLAHRDVMRLSGGQRQLVMFAQVMLRRPEILMLDEPVSALDMHHQLNLLEKVHQYTRDKNLVTLTVLHDLSLAAQFSDSLIMLGEGKLQAFGTPSDVLQAGLIGRLYRVEVEILRDRYGLPVIRPHRQPEI